MAKLIPSRLESRVDRPAAADLMATPALAPAAVVVVGVRLQSPITQILSLFHSSHSPFRIWVDGEIFKIEADICLKEFAHGKVDPTEAGKKGGKASGGSADDE
jgi:hypothetical protein